MFIIVRIIAGMKFRARFVCSQSYSDFHVVKVQIKFIFIYFVDMEYKRSSRNCFHSDKTQSILNSVHGSTSPSPLYYLGYLPMRTIPNFVEIFLVPPFSCADGNGLMCRRMLSFNYDMQIFVSVWRL